MLVVVTEYDPEWPRAFDQEAVVLRTAVPGLKAKPVIDIMPDYLRAHPEMARQYGELKAELAPRCNHDIEVYMDGKDEFVKRIQQASIQWCKTR